MDWVDGSFIELMDRLILTCAYMQELPDSLESLKRQGHSAGKNRRISGSVIKQALNLPDGGFFILKISELPAKTPEYFDERKFRNLESTYSP